ncbi:MAG: hypothetical protein FWD17_06215, partial [Polyangiaceae bacterium]|nr:hypothetical protein [Polyangiaceae bacterium]
YEMAYPGTVQLEARGGWGAPLQTPMVHVRASRDHVCVDRLAGAVGAFAAAAPAALAQIAGDPIRPGPRTIDVSVFSARSRYALRCTPAGAQTSADRH